LLKPLPTLPPLPPVPPAPPVVKPLFPALHDMATAAEDKQKIRAHK